MLGYCGFIFEKSDRGGRSSPGKQRTGFLAFLFPRATSSELIVLEWNLTVDFEFSLLLM
jgi:hypothetical protein